MSEQEQVVSENLKSSPLMPIFVVIFFLFILLFSYFIFKVLHRKYLSAESRIELLNELSDENEKRYGELSNYEEVEYTKKFNEYMEFLVDNVSQARIDVKVIYSELPKHKFKTSNLLILGGRTKNEFAKNQRRKYFLLSDYILYKNESETFLKNKKIYKKKVHKQLGKPFSESDVAITNSDGLMEAEKDYKSSKSGLKATTTRLKGKIAEFKSVTKEYKLWRSNPNPNASPSGEVDPKTGEVVEVKRIVDISGKSENEINEIYKEKRNRLMLEINALKILRQKDTEDYNIKKARLKKFQNASK